MSDRPTQSRASRRRLQEWRRLSRKNPSELSRELEPVSIREQVEAALSLPCGDRIPFLVHSPKPMRLVRSLPDGEFYLTIREAGPVDAMPVLALASAGQIHHLLDLELWRRDRFDAQRAGAWTAVMVEAGESTLRRFVREVEDDILVLLFRDWAGVKQIEFDDQVPIHGPGESEAGDERGFASPDGYFRFSPPLAEHMPAVRRLAEMLFHEHPERYQRILWASLNELPSEVEEEAFRWRQSRMEEHGYPPFEEALSIYAAPGEAAENDDDAGPSPRRGPEAPAPPLTALASLEDAGLLPAAVESLPVEDRDRFVRQIVSLANRVLVADCRDTGDPDGHRRAVRKSAGYIGIALAMRSRSDPGEAARTIAEVPLIDLFRDGYAHAAKLRRRAGLLVRDGWASCHPQALELLDPPIRPRVEGLLEDRPLYLDLGAGGEAPSYRDFERSEEIEETGRALELAEAIGTLFIDRLHLDVPRIMGEAQARPEEPPTFSRLLLTMMAWHAARGDLRLEPLPADVTADFLRTVASRRTAHPDAPGRALDRLIGEIQDRLEPAPSEAAALAAYGKACLEELASECGNLDPGIPVSVREVSCLLLLPADAGTGAT